MTAHRISLLAVCLLTTFALADTSVARSIDMRLPYDGPALLGYQGIQDCGTTGTLCIDLPPGIQGAAFDVRDASQTAVGGTYYLVDEAGDYLGSGIYCKGAALSVPRDAATLVVRVEHLPGTLSCAEDGSIGATSRGMLRATLR